VDEFRFVVCGRVDCHQVSSVPSEHACQIKSQLLHFRPRLWRGD
jgi:hypothetical protein